MELYRGRLIAYSLGNFCSWESFNLNGPLGITAIVQLELAANGVLVAVDVESGKIVRPGRPQPDPDEQAVELIRELSKADFGDPFLDENGAWRRPKAMPPPSSRAERRP